MSVIDGSPRSNLVGDHVGILSLGALGATYFYWLTSALSRTDAGVSFLRRAGSETAAAVEAAGKATFRAGGASLEVPAPRLFGADFPLRGPVGELPEVILVTLAVDQLHGIVGDLRQLFCAALTGGWAGGLPIVVLCSNGLYYSDLIRSVSRGLPPSVDEEAVRALARSRLLRASAYQWSRREGHLERATYVIGEPGRTLVAGGDERARRRALDVLQRRCAGMFEDGGTCAPSIEFGKAPLSFVCNTMALDFGLSEEGEFHPLTVSEVVRRLGDAALATVMRHFAAVGRSAGVLEVEAAVLLERTREVMNRVASHISSSVQGVLLRLQRGEAVPILPATEVHLLGPLLGMSRGLGETHAFFEAVDRRLRRKLSRLNEVRGLLSSGGEARVAR